MCGVCRDENAGQIITVQHATNAVKVRNSSYIGNITDISKFNL